jgi:hypothetical protein
MSVKRLAVG